MQRGGDGERLVTGAPNISTWQRVALP